MTVSELKRRVFEANQLLPKYGLVKFTWGNVSEIDRERGIVAIKPGGVAYEDMREGDIVLVNLDGSPAESGLKPSSDTPTHLALYRAFADIGGIVHTHSAWATIFAQTKRGVKPLGTTHADYFFGEVPCTRELTKGEIEGDYELNTGKVIVETCRDSYRDVPAALAACHGPFAWGANAAAAVMNAAVLEEAAFMAHHCGDIPRISQELLSRHFLRKHGKNAYYGQN